MNQSHVTVLIKADTRQLRYQLTLVRLKLERSAWRRLRLRRELAQIRRERFGE
jgi:hypothetical protein